MRFGPLSPDAPFSLAAMGVCFDPLTAASVALTAIGTGVSAVGTIAAGDQAAAAGESKARQLEQAATQERAKGQRQMFEKQRETQLVQSKLQARASADGGSATDPGVLKISEDIAGRGEQQALMDLANGENSARGMEDQAKASRISGQAAQSGSRFSAFGTIAQGAGTGFDRYARFGGGYRLPTADPSYSSPVAT